MADVLSAAVKLAQREKKQRKGRRGYSDELKRMIREAAKEEPKTSIAKATGISYPTVNKIVGKKGKIRKKTATRRKPVRRRASRRATSRSPRNSTVTLEITVSLPSGAKLRYSDIVGLQKDARVLSKAAEQVTG